MNRVLQVLGIIGAVIVVGGIAGLMYLGSVGPGISVVPGSAVTSKQMDRIRELELLEPGEEIAYFYSDAFLDIADGLYFVTDRNLVVYVQEWHDPKFVLPFDQISSLSFAQDDSFFDDSQVTVVSSDGLELQFPLSSEEGGDQKFYDYLHASCHDLEAMPPFEIMENGETVPDVEDGGEDPPS